MRDGSGFGIECRVPGRRVVREAREVRRTGGRISWHGGRHDER
ncbi:hypothetical protein [Streptomyces sp. NPDC046862]